MKIVNLTPHPIRIVTDNADLTIEPTSPAARVTTEDQQIGFINGIPVIYKQIGAAENLPEQKPETFYIVSRMVAEQYPNRGDLLIPNDTERDQSGRIVACHSLALIELTSHWEDVEWHDDEDYTVATCSVCGGRVAKHLLDNSDPSFFEICPYCGAKMG